MGTKFTYKRTVKPKNGKAKFKRENGVKYDCYRDENGNQRVKTIKYRKLVRNNVSNN